MNRQILIISSSPRKGGNSDMLCDEFMKGCVKAGHDVEKINLREHKINFMVQEPGSLVIFREILPCRKLTRWAKIFAD